MQVCEQNVPQSCAWRKRKDIPKQQQQNPTTTTTQQQQKPTTTKQNKTNKNYQDSHYNRKGSRQHLELFHLALINRTTVFACVKTVSCRVV